MIKKIVKLTSWINLIELNDTAAQRRSSEESDPGIQAQPSLEPASKIKVCSKYLSVKFSVHHLH